MSRDTTNDDAFRQEVCDWLTANGVNPSQVIAYPRASISGGQLTFERFVWRDGRVVVAPNDEELLTETATVPVLVEPTGDVAEWLRPRCQECGR